MQVDLLTSATDEALVAAVGQGHEPALAEVFRRHSAAVAGLARRLLGDGALAEDVTQDIFLRLWREPTRFDATRGKLRTLLLTQAHGRAVDIVRTHNARQRREMRVGLEPQTPQSGVDSALMALTLAEQVKQALLGIPPDERVPIELAYYGGHTYRQVAVILDLPEGTVKTRIRAGLRRLHEIMNDDHVIDATGPDKTAASRTAASKTTASKTTASKTATSKTTASKTAAAEQFEKKESPWTGS